jgi:hypothetical protein
MLEQSKNLHFVLDTISSVLTSNTSPVLAEIIMTFPSYQRLPPAPDSLTTLDVALVAHPAEPAIHWLMYSASENGPILLARFGDLLKLALPNTHARGRLMIEYRIARNGIYDVSSGWACIASRSLWYILRADGKWVGERKNKYYPPRAGRIQYCHDTYITTSIYLTDFKLAPPCRLSPSSNVSLPLPAKGSLP